MGINSDFNKWSDELNKTVSSIKQNKTPLTDYSEKTQETGVALIRQKLAFSDIQFSFPVTDKLTTIRIPAFLTSHSDNFSPQWNPQSVYGRADPIPIYRNTTRTISLALKIPNQSVEDANANFKSLGILVKNLYPVYKSFGSADIAGAFRDAISGLAPNQSIVGAPLTRIKFANLVCNSDNPDLGLLGYITGLSITTEVQNGFLIYSDESENENLLFPRMVNFTISFSPLHEHKVGWGTSNNWLGKDKDNFPYLTRKDGTKIGTEAINVFGSVISGDSGAMVNAVLNGSRR